MLHVEFHPRAEKELLKIPKEFRLNILDQLTKLEPLSHPLQHRNVRKLRDCPGGAEYRLRKGTYRAKFAFLKPGTVWVLHVEHRQAGY